MMNFRVQKVCAMIGEAVKENLNHKLSASISKCIDVSNFTEENQIEINRLVSLLSFFDLAKNEELKTKKVSGRTINITDSIFLNPQVVFTYLEELHTSLKNKICFSKWYFEEWVNFYCKQDKEYYCILEVLNVVAGNAFIVSNFDRFPLDEIFEKISKKFINKYIGTFDLYRTIARKMVLDQNRLQIPYAKQFHNLKFLDFNMDFLSKLNEMDVPKKENKPIEKNDKEKRKTTEVNEIVSNMNEDVRVLEKNNQSTLKEEKENYSKQMKKYMIYDEFVGIIEGEDMQNFLSIASKLYSATRVHLLKEKLIANNSRLKVERRREAIYKIIHEEDREYYNYLCDLKETENNNSPYSFYILNTLDKINALIEDIEENPDDVLVELYLEETRDLLANMRVCLPQHKREC